MRKHVIGAAAALMSIGMIAGTASAAHAEINDPSINQGKPTGNASVYYTTNGPLKGTKLPVYAGHMASFPAGKQFAGIENTTGVKRFIAQEYRGVSGGTVTCVAAGKILWLDSSATKAWIVQSPVNYACTVGKGYRVP